MRVQRTEKQKTSSANWKTQTANDDTLCIIREQQSSRALRLTEKCQEGSECLLVDGPSTR